MRTRSTTTFKEKSTGVPKKSNFHPLPVGKKDLCAKNVVYYTESTRFGSKKKNLCQSTETVQMNPDLQNTKYLVKSVKKD
jgi:hypothetical protein